MVDPNKISRIPAETFRMAFCRVLSAYASKSMLCIAAYRLSRGSLDERMAAD